MNAGDFMRSRQAGFAARLILAAACMLVIVHIAGPWATRGILPVISKEIEFLGRDFEVLQIAYEIQDNTAQIRLRTRIHQPFELPDGSTRPHADVVVSQSAYIFAVPVIILFSLIFAITGMRGFSLTRSFLIALPLAIIILFIDMPMVFLYYLNKARPVDGAYAGMLNMWFFILNSGGRQFLGIFAALMASAPHFLHRRVHSDA